ncbi:probable serine/threonine-protein kinase pXi [Microplitis mediator]|uniref:probable serine/threonine-protein kinase pXi n=1 Tax=Microplitis mediator TaxID=375433 RepID=UPI0025546181|nr:probable serine/threonine-protein kinase pXi [Microplitis mediator]
MMEGTLSRGTSLSGDSNLSNQQLSPRIVMSLEERLIIEHDNLTSKNITPTTLRTPTTKKAKRVRFFRNGDKFYTGIVMAVTPERYRSFDSLTTDLTRALLSNVTLPNGVRTIYSMDGKKVLSVSDLEDGKCYVVSGHGELFKKVEYSSTKVRRGSSLSGLPQSPAGTGRIVTIIPLCVRARIVTLIRHGSKPRKVLRLLLNKRNAASLEHVLEAITQTVKLDCGAVKRVYTLSGKLVISLEQFFEDEEVFLAYGSEKSTQEDFELDVEESKSVQSFRRGPCVSKRQSGPMPVMPRKTGKRTLTAPQVRTPSPSTLTLPQPLRMHYTVGHVIGDGNFAVVRHCTHKQSGAEYAMKIVDKSKCQGKETMLASEVAILRQVCHPNIISLISEQETTDQLFLVMELVKGGDLFDAIAAATKFSEAEASVMIGHLTSALAYLHFHQIVHRDVKPENLLVEMEGSHVRCLKLGDFGLAQVVREPLYTVCGTPTYVAPEILEETGYGLKIDVWAAGVILYILLCGFPPFASPENDQEELFERILGGQYEFISPYWDSISDSAKQLISNMLQAQPELRFSAEDVLDHPWLVSFLGGEQSTSGCIASSESPQQHRNQQCQPLRVNTSFELNSSKQWDSDEAPGICESPISRHQQWTDGLKKKNVQVCDETDRFNGNSFNNEDPMSLSAECLKEISVLTTSMRDLMHNIDDDDISLGKKKNSKSVTSSLNSILENVNCNKKNNNNGGYQSPVSNNLHSTNKRNGNSLSDIHSKANNKLKSTVITPTSSSSSYSSSIRNDCHQLQDKNLRCNNSNKKIKNNIYNNVANGAKASRRDNDNDNKYSSVENFSQSTDGLSVSSDNNIETSDSFVNIQFAKYSKNIGGCSSSQSTQSSESLDSIPIRGSKLNNTTDSGVKKINQDISRQVLKRNPKYNLRPTANRNSRLIESSGAAATSATKSSGSKNSSLIPTLRINDHNLLTDNKLDNKIKVSAGDQVKLREKKQTAIKRDGNKKRFSCFSNYSVKKSHDDAESDKLNNSVPVSSTRKCSSTDELREDKQVGVNKNNIKANRFSLYYTPQLPRKSYELDSTGGKVTGKSIKNSNVTSGGSSRPTSWKIPESSRPADDHEAKRNNRKSLVDPSSYSSAKRANKINRLSVNLQATINADGKIK